jgi:hypothetical protein
MAHRLTPKEIIYYNWPRALALAIFFGWFISLFCITPGPSPEYVLFGYFAVLIAGGLLMLLQNYIEYGRFHKGTLLYLASVVCVVYLLLRCAGRGCRYRTSV